MGQTVKIKIDAVESRQISNAMILRALSIGIEAMGISERIECIKATEDQVLTNLTPLFANAQDQLEAIERSGELPLLKHVPEDRLLGDKGSTQEPITEEEPAGNFQELPDDEITKQMVGAAL